MLLFREAARERVEEALLRLREKAVKTLEELPGELEFNETVTFRGRREFRIPITREKAYVVIAYNGTLNVNVSGKAVVEEPEPGLYVIAVYTGKPGELSLSLEVGNITNVSISISVKTVPLADFNDDGVVDYRDLAVLAGAYGTSKGGKGYSVVADVNCDGIVDYRDLAILATKYGEHAG